MKTVSIHRYVDLRDGKPDRSEGRRDARGFMVQRLPGLPASPLAETEARGNVLCEMLKKVEVLS